MVIHKFWCNKTDIPALAAVVLVLLPIIKSHAREEQAERWTWDETDAADCSGRPITSADLLGLREMGGVLGSGLSVSPDGHYVAFEIHQAHIAANGYRVAWFVSEAIPGNDPVNVGDGGDATLFRNRLSDGRVVGAWIADYPKWSPNSRGIAYRKKLHGETQIWWSSRNGKAVEQLTHNAADVEEFDWNHDGSQLYFTTGATRARLQQQKDARYRAGHAYDYNKDWSTIDGRPFYPPHALTEGRPQVWVLDIESGVERLATIDELVEYEKLKRIEDEQHKLPEARQIARTKDKRGVAWVQPDDPQKQGVNPPMTLYASLAADGSDAVRCPAEECTGAFDLARPLRDGLHWSTVDDEVLFVRKEGMGYSKRSLYAWRIEDEHVRRVLTTDHWICDCSIAGQRALCFLETPTYPRTVVSIDLRNGSIETLVDPNPKFQCLRIGEVELMEWKNSRGYGTFGYLVKPPDYDPDERYPLVFVGYRARFALRGGVGDEYPVHLLAVNGFVVLVYDKPTTYAAQEVYSDPLDIAKARWGPDLFDVRMPLASFESAIRVLAESGLIDPTRVAVTGLSNGVGHVNYALIHSDLFAAAITSSSDFGPNGRVLVGASGETSRKYRREIGAGRYPGPHGFLFPHISLALNTGRISEPLLVNVSDHEHPWALEEVVALIEDDKPVEMIVYPDESHIIWHPAHRASIYERNVDWLRFWLQDVEDSDPAKSPQYVRWRALRDKAHNRVKRRPLPIVPADSASPIRQGGTASEDELGGQQATGL